ncbi:MAG: hypothetical protein H7330_02635, partial [Hymenobacteraceae bacterium]|nr:hypothetical protein [Hymenobacteraceae bacterium]
FQGLLPGLAGTEATAARQPLHLLRTNYRNAPPVTALANRLLTLKNRRFGSLDRESTFLVEAATQQSGEVVFLTDTPDAQRQLNARIRRSAQWAVVVLREEDKAAVRRFFDTPLLFSVHEAKGLEYENIVLVNCISQHGKLFREVAADLTPADLDLAGADVRYARAPDRADHHAAHYTFFVNALYVAVTRARQSLFVMERADRHPLLPLLGLTTPSPKVELTEQTSTPDEWRREARRPAQQGRTEQAAAIREQVLEQQAPTWEPLTSERFEELKTQAFDPTHYNRKAKDRVFETAVLHGDIGTIQALQQLDGRQRYNPARAVSHNTRNHLIRKFYDPYRHNQLAPVAAYVARYGADVRDEHGLTPLLAASLLRVYPLVVQLRRLDVNLTQPDLMGRLPLHILLMHYAEMPTAVETFLGDLYLRLLPPTVRFRYLGKIIKLPQDEVETIAFHYLLFGQLPLLRRKYLHAHHGATTAEARFVEAADLEALLQTFADGAIAPRHKTRRFVNTLLAQHEVGKQFPSSQQLWLRVKHGQYMLNPMIDLEVAPDQWHSYSAIVRGQLVQPLGKKPRVSFDSRYAQQYCSLMNSFGESLEKYYAALHPPPKAPNAPAPLLPEAPAEADTPPNTNAATR